MSKENQLFSQILKVKKKSNFFLPYPRLPFHIFVFVTTHSVAGIAVHCVKTNEGLI